MKSICAAGATVKGIDVSHFQSNVDWHAQIRNGVQFGFAKATEGLTFVDRSFQKHWLNMKSFGLVRGAYHFFHPNIDAVRQAQHFCSVVGHLDPQDKICLDWETTDGVPSTRDVKNGFQFLETVEKLTGRRPGIYLGPYFGQALNLPPEASGYWLWVAHYGVKCPLVPEPWASRKPWTFWQFTENGMDTNLFNGTIGELRALS